MVIAREMTTMPIDKSSEENIPTIQRLTTKPLLVRGDLSGGG
jgi:hypothetical protein